MTVHSALTHFWLGICIALLVSTLVSASAFLVREENHILLLFLKESGKKEAFVSQEYFGPYFPVCYAMSLCSLP